MTDTAAHPLTYALGYALIGFLWQGAVVGLVTVVLLALTRRAAPTTRYAISCLSLLVMATMPLVTFARAWTAAGVVASTSGSAAAPLPGLSVTDWAPAVVAGPVEVFRLVAAGTWSPAIVMAWGAGVLLLSVRLLVSWTAIGQLRRDGVEDHGRDLTQTAARLSSILGLDAPVAIVRSALVEVPAVVGWLRPVIVVPVSAMAGLSPSQFEAILAHELAHIRRRDHLVNAAQTLVETLLFYHPSVWWVSRQVRVEREHCCDDVALSVGGTRAEYARALTALEDLRSSGSILAVSAGDGSLVARVRRVLGAAPQPMGRPGIALLIALAVGVPSAAIAASNLETTVGTPAVVSVTPVDRSGISPSAMQAAQQSTATAEAQITALEEMYRRARLENDSVTLGRLLDAAFIGVGSTDTVTRNKSETLARWRGVPVSSLRTETRQVQMDDGAAIVRGTETLTAGGSTLQVRYARAWKLNPAVGWTLVSSIQMPVPAARRPTTPPPPPPPPPPGMGTVRESIAVTGQSSAVRVGQNGVTAPTKIKDVRPMYPPLAKAAGVQGLVFLESIIDPQGNVTNLKVIRSTGSAELDQAAIDAVSQWRYTPTLLNGEPVSVICTMTVHFTLKN